LRPAKRASGNSAGLDDLQQSDVGIDLVVLLCRHCDSDLV
jgi:hypothetical protein